MKKIKTIITAITLILGFVIQSETFQAELSCFQNWYYSTTNISFQNSDERIRLLQELYQYSREKNVRIFASDEEELNTFSHVIHIFGDDALKDVFEKEYGITEKTYRSVLSGERRVVWHDFEELTDNRYRYVYTIAFIGDEEAICEVYDYMKDNFTLTRPMVTTASESDIIYLMWGMIVGIMVLLSCLETALNKKEVVVRIFMGESVWRIILKSIGLEILVDVLEFILIKSVVFHFISGECMERTVLLVYGAGVLVSCLLRLSYADYDIKRAFSNAGDSKAVLNFTYVLKIAITAVSVFLLVNNFGLLIRDLKEAARSGRLENYSAYSYLELIQKKYYRPDMSDEKLSEEANAESEFVHSVYEELYKGNYEKTKPVICQNVFHDTDKNLDFILVNEFGESFLADFTKGLEYDKNADVIYFIPDKWKDDGQVFSDAVDSLQNTIEDTEKLKNDVVFYSGNRYFSYINQYTSSGLENAQNPVIIFSRYDGVVHKDNLCFWAEPAHMMFRITDADIELLEEKYHLEEKGYETVRTNVQESSRYRNSLLRMAVAFLSSVCVFTLILQMVLIVSIVSMEYRFRAMELAVKKILGYSMWKKNKRLIFSSVFSNLITVPVLAVIGNITGMYKISSCVRIGICILLLELVVIVINIFRVESKNIQKILKGGCL